ncbi:hypothetical protein GLOIN_2v1874127 [Rhizophagus clarus]|uniref:Ion transport domain-containing protein n=1 Tax=Rhizophagus clarus TaxID=94130 RepID=A0A8H3M7A9_9GLOM|nr:hypothetical protein GLOIN_2v1874127 [Rhizophagus clarus]
MSQMDEFSVEIDDKIDNNNDVHNVHNDKIDVGNNKPHNGKPITKIEVSPNEKYLVTYSGEDNSIVGWNVDNDEDEGLLKDCHFPFNSPIQFSLIQICVSDDKKLVYIGHEGIYDMMNYQKIKLDCGVYNNYAYCTFNLEGNLILYYNDVESAIIFFYSAQAEKTVLKCERMYKMPKNIKDYIFISISKYDKLYLLSNNSIYEWNIVTEKRTKLIVIDEEIKYKDTRISSNEDFVCLKIKNKIIIYSVELEIPIASLDINNVIQLRKFAKHPVLCFLLFPLLLPLLNDNIPSSNGYWGTIMRNRRKKFWSKLQISNNIKATNKYIFGALDADIWKIDLKEIIQNITSSYKNFNELNSDNPGELNFDEFIENSMVIKEEILYFDNDFKFDEKINMVYDHLHVLLLNSYTETIRVLSQDIDSNVLETRNVFEQNSIKWHIYNSHQEKTINLHVFKKNNDNDEWNLICTRVEKFEIARPTLLKIKLFGDSYIILITRLGPLIYHFNESDRSISLIYFYYIYLSNKEIIPHYKKVYSKSTLPLPNYESFKYNDNWVLDAKHNKEILLKYGVELLTFAIKEHKLELIDEIYKECINYFKQDLKNNRMFLSVITSTLPLLNEYYPEYILRYSLDTTMIIDSPSFRIEYPNSNLHLFSFLYPQIINITHSILWFKYNILMRRIYNNHKILFAIIIFIQFLVILLTFPVYFAIFYLLSKYNYINDISESDMFSIYFIIPDIITSKFSKRLTTPTIIFMNPFINFVTYPKDYNWLSELIWPQSSPFVKTVNRDIYKTWSGESLINFKWNNYGKHYYAIIWIGFMAFLGCFTAAATIPHIDDNIRNKLLISSIVLGVIHLSFEIRQMIYDFNKWIHDFWNLFDVIAYVLPIFTSIIWLQSKYSNILVSQFSFDQHTNNDDPNNPWNLVTTYYQVFENGTVNPNPYIIQPPNGNTNMFVDFRTAIFAMYKFLTGDSSALSNWSYTDNPSLAIMIVLFSLLIVVYLMNLFIGLLNNAIEKDNDRVSYLVQKAEILAEIELFYLLPHQRRWYTWFPDVIYYYANVDKSREKIKEMNDKGEWKTNEFPELRKNLMEKLNIQLINETSLQNILAEIQEMKQKLQ